MITADFRSVGHKYIITYTMTMSGTVGVLHDQ